MKRKNKVVGCNCSKTERTKQQRNRLKSENCRKDKGEETTLKKQPWKLQETLYSTFNKKIEAKKETLFMFVRSINMLLIT